MTKFIPAVNDSQQRVIELLQWNLDTYCNFVFNCGLQYLEKYIGRDKDAIDMLSRRKEFWNWWQSLFNARDRAFINACDVLPAAWCPLSELHSMYDTIHNPSILICEIHPPSIVYGEHFTKVEMSY